LHEGYRQPYSRSYQRIERVSRVKIPLYDRKPEERISTMTKKDGEKLSIKKLRGKEDYNEWSKRMLTDPRQE